MNVTALSAAAKAPAMDFTVQFVATVLGVLVAFALDHWRQERASKKLDEIRDDERAELEAALMKLVGLNSRNARRALEPLMLDRFLPKLPLHGGLWEAYRHRYVELRPDPENVADFDAFFARVDAARQVFDVLIRQAPLGDTRPTGEAERAELLRKELKNLLFAIRAGAASLADRMPDAVDHEDEEEETA